MTGHRTKETIPVPPWPECDRLRTAGERLNPLQQFIYDYDDADHERSVKFVADVAALLIWAREQP